VDFARQLAKTRRYRVVLTRSVDEFIPARDRVTRARARDADLVLVYTRRCTARCGNARLIGIYLVGASF
jgi:hypothetical protein